MNVDQSFDRHPTSSPMEMLEHFRPPSPSLITPFLQWAWYEMLTPSGSLLFSRITSEERDYQERDTPANTVITRRNEESLNIITLSYRHTHRDGQKNVNTGTVTVKTTETANVVVIYRSKSSQSQRKRDLFADPSSRCKHR